MIRRRLELESGRVDKQAPFSVALAFPNSYAVGMSSLGPLWLYGTIQAEPGMACERAFLPDGVGSSEFAGGLGTYESGRPLGDFPVLAVTVSYELEVAGVVQLLQSAGMPVLSEERSEEHPFVLVGGPLTWANPTPLSPFVDAVVMGEADQLAIEVLRQLRDTSSRERALDRLAVLDGVWVPARHGDQLPSLTQVDEALLPAFSHLRSPEAELKNMVLVEAVRGCARTCRYCVMRRRPGGGMRRVPVERILARIPADAKRVGLVGAGVSDHPQIAEVVRQLVDRGMGVGLSSLRPERLDDEFVAALAAAGYRTLTTAMDGLSQRLRDGLERRVAAPQLIAAAELVRRHRLARLKLYVMVGVPGERDEDVDEAAALIGELSRIVPVSLAVSPFCAKRNTPFDGEPFAGISVVDRRLRRLRRLLRGRAELRAASSRWAWVEHQLAQGTEAHGLAVLDAMAAGGGFQAYRAALEGLSR